jgi:hypothetical protein
MADDKSDNKDLIEDFLGQMSTYIKTTVEELKSAGSTPPAGDGKPGEPPAKTTTDDTPPPAKKKHFWFGEIDD